MADAAAVRTREALPGLRAGVPQGRLVLRGALRRPQARRHGPPRNPRRAGPARPHAHGPGLRAARHLPAPRRAAVGRPPGEGRRGRGGGVPLPRLDLPPGRGLFGHPLAGGGPGAGGRAHPGAPLSAGREPGAGVDLDGVRPARRGRAGPSAARLRRRRRRRAQARRPHGLRRAHRPRGGGPDGPRPRALRAPAVVVALVQEPARQGQAVRAARVRLRHGPPRPVQEQPRL